MIFSDRERKTEVAITTCNLVLPETLYHYSLINTTFRIVLFEYSYEFVTEPFGDVKKMNGCGEHATTQFKGLIHLLRVRNRQEM